MQARTSKIGAYRPCIWTFVDETAARVVAASWQKRADRLPESGLGFPPPGTTKPPRQRGFRSKRLKGLEPSTFCMASRRSSQLSYSRKWGEYSQRFPRVRPVRALPLVALAAAVWPAAAGAAVDRTVTAGRLTATV